MNYKDSKKQSGKSNDVEKEIERINMNALSLQFPNIKQILKKCTYTQLYELDLVSKVWHVNNIAGPLFLFNVKNSQFGNIIIVNQKSPNDFKTEINPSMKFELSEKNNFIYFKMTDGTINGLWISQENELKELYQAIQDIISQNNNIKN